MITSREEEEFCRRTALRNCMMLTRQGVCVSVFLYPTLCVGACAIAWERVKSKNLGLMPTRVAQQLLAAADKNGNPLFFSSL